MANLKRRIFLTENRTDFAQIFSISQVESDGSIYVSWPSISDTRWLAIDRNNLSASRVPIDSSGQGKVSFHGSGRVHFQGHDSGSPPDFRIDGNILMKSKSALGVRHLVTVFLAKPSFAAESSPAHTRKSDLTIRATTVRPMVMVFLAIPKTRIRLRFQFSLLAEDMEVIPDDILGYGTFPLVLHDLFWIAYRTRHMDNWPLSTHASVSDGADVPLFIGQPGNSMKVEVVQPRLIPSPGELFLSIGPNQTAQSLVP